MHKWNWILAIEAVILIVLVVVLVRQPAQPCTLSFEVHKGVNFNQPYPTYTNCGPGSKPPIVR